MDQATLVLAVIGALATVGALWAYLASPTHKRRRTKDKWL
jgi:hypothetical protein